MDMSLLGTHTCGQIYAIRYTANTLMSAPRWRTNSTRYWTVAAVGSSSYSRRNAFSAWANRVHNIVLPSRYNRHLSRVPYTRLLVFPMARAYLLDSHYIALLNFFIVHLLCIFICPVLLVCSVLVSFHKSMFYYLVLLC